MWKIPHLSEDGEALPKIGHRSVQSERSSTPDGWSDAGRASSWFALYTICRHEKRVAQHLSQREIEFYLPLYRSERKWGNGSRVTLELPLFPGYLFVRVRRSERVSVLSVPGVLAVLVGASGELAALPDSMIDTLRSGLELRVAEPHPFLTVGQQVRIRSGALAGMEGIVVRKKNKFRVVLTLQHMMRSIAVEVDGKDIEPLQACDLACA
jgi:transcription antitermination factor NusG